MTSSLNATLSVDYPTTRVKILIIRGRNEFSDARPACATLLIFSGEAPVSRTIDIQHADNLAIHA